MAENQTIMQETYHRKGKKRNFIDPQVKLGLINSVMADHLPIYQAAILHKIKYSSAKHIVRNYQSDKDNFFQRQRKRSRKVFCNNIKAIIDLNTGNIQLLKSNQAISPSNNRQNNSIAYEKTITELSIILSKQIQKINNNRIILKGGYTLENNNNTNTQEEQINFFKRILNQQYQEMMNM